MKRNTDNVIKAFRDEFMSRDVAICPQDWQADVMRCIADCNLNRATLTLNSSVALLWPLAWSAAAAAVLVVSAVFFLDPAAATSSASQIFSDISTAQQIVAGL